MFCPKCARENPENNKFCNGCGSSLRIEAFPPITLTPPPPPVMHPPAAVPQQSAVGDRSSKEHGVDTPQNVETEVVYHNEVSAIFEDKEILTEIGGDENMSKVFEEAEGLLDDLFPETIVAGATPPSSESKMSVPEPESEHPNPQLSITPVAEKSVNVPNALHVLKTQRRSGITKWVIIGISTFVVMLLFGLFFALRRSAESGSNKSVAGLEQTKSTTEKQPVNEPPPGMAYVPGGEFLMGSDTGDEYSKPAHRVAVKPFFMDLTEVTNEQYKKCVDTTNCKPPPNWTNGAYPVGKEKYPVTGVNWDDANTFAKWAGKRLPTEVEWEFAARGTDGRIYPWGSDWKPELANADKQMNSMVEVGSKSGKSPFGCLDMSGNAFEWTSSDANAYPNGGAFPAGITDPKILRGGYYGSSSAKATTTFRVQWGARTEASYENSGFRCALDAPRTESQK